MAFCRWLWLGVQPNPYRELPEVVAVLPEFSYPPFETHDALDGVDNKAGVGRQPLNQALF